jgi:hypothetical protein
MERNGLWFLKSSTIYRCIVDFPIKTSIYILFIGGIKLLSLLGLPQYFLLPRRNLKTQCGCGDTRDTQQVPPVRFSSRSLGWTRIEQLTSWASGTHSWLNMMTGWSMDSSWLGCNLLWPPVTRGFYPVGRQLTNFKDHPSGEMVQKGPASACSL